MESAMSAAFASLARLCNRLETSTNLVIDADTHATDTSALADEIATRYRTEPGYYHGRPISAEDIVREMNMADVDMALCWQNPAATWYPGDPDDNAAALLEANRYIRDSADRYPDKIVPAGWVDPRALGLSNTLRLVETLVLEFGFAIVKMNPAQNQFPIDSPEVSRVVERIADLGAVPAFHYGADSPYTPASGLRRIAEMLGDHPVLAVHMGGGGASYLEAESLYRESRALGLERGNVRFILSAKRDTHIEETLIAYQLAGEPFCRNLFCASDAPYGRMTWNFGGYRAMFKSLIDGRRHTDARVRGNPGLFTQEAAARYLGGNFAAFFTRAARNLMDRQRTQHGAVVRSGS
jgi:predicted TIM-barrel fold metal-dependent hydrolase